MMHEQSAEKNAAATLDQIREGGTFLVSVAMERLEDVKLALQAGRFDDAHDRAAELMGRLAPLSQAQQYLGTFAQSYVARAVDVTEGMVLRSWGTVTNVERETVPVAGDDPHLHVKIHVEGEDEPKVVNGEQEIIVLRAPE
jgi:hypothetical protein